MIRTGRALDSGWFVIKAGMRFTWSDRTTISFSQVSVDGLLNMVKVLKGMEVACVTRRSLEI